MLNIYRVLISEASVSNYIRPFFFGLCCSPYELLQISMLKMVQNNIRRSPFVVLYCGRDEVMCFCETCVLMGASQATHPFLLPMGIK
jgi:hypothetical protein